MSITITVPNDDPVALRAMAKALEEIAVARGAPAHSLQVTMGPICTVPMSSEQEEVLREKLKRIKDNETRAKADGTDPISQEMCGAQVDTTSQQVESLAIPVEANGATYETDLGSDKPEVVCVADSNGTPWDERIHSASKALNADGTWRLRRKPKDMDEAEWGFYVWKIRGEIDPENIVAMKEFAESLPDVGPTSDDLESFDENSIMKQDTKPKPSVTPEGDDFHLDTGVVTEQQIATIPAPPLPVPPVLTPAQEAGIAEVVARATMTFPQVMQFLTERHGRITSAQVDDIIADMGLNSIMDLNTQPEHTGPFITRVKALLGE